VRRLDGKVALITGGSSGIGLETARLFAAEGAFVFVTGRRETELKAAEAAIGARVRGIRGDIADLGDLDRLFQKISAERARIDILFANAGLGEFAPLGGITEAHFDKTFAVKGDARFVSSSGFLQSVGRRPSVSDAGDELQKLALPARAGLANRF